MEKNIEDSIKDGLTMTTIYNYWIIFCTEGIKQKATNSISRCHGYHETCWLNIWRSKIIQSKGKGNKK